ncbi:MAG: MscL family protein [Candidatus Magasanikbacteria bacterium]|nr:MscL family protein [Candidatus Magasanikbacteria bacterium]
MFFRDFFSFLKEYNIIQLALAFIMGAASNSVVKSLVDNVFMPFVIPLSSAGWREATLRIGPIALKWGAFLADFLHFIILAFAVFIIAKKILKQEKVSIKK